MTEAGAEGQGFCRKCPKTDAIACIFKALCGIARKQKVFLPNLNIIETFFTLEFGMNKVV